MHYYNAVQGNKFFMKVPLHYSKIRSSILALLVSICGQPAYSAGEVTVPAGQNVSSLNMSASSALSSNVAALPSKEASAASKGMSSSSGVALGQGSKQAAPLHGSTIKMGENHLLIPLPQEETVGRQDIEYLCRLDDNKASEAEKSLRASLPNGVFTATYFSADAMALVVLPVDGRVMVFANVVADSGSKYVGDRYTWWAKGSDVIFSRIDKGDAEIACHVEASSHNTGVRRPLGAQEREN